MVKTVDRAFNFFMTDYVNLDSSQTKLARSSRDWLISQIRLLSAKDNKFPILYSEKDIDFGSFARCTKKRELDDIDRMIALIANGCIYYELTDKIEIHVPDYEDRLKALCHDNTNILNSRKVIYKFISVLKLVPQYQKADIKRNQEAATLNLISYPWTFDIVPCFFTQKNYLSNRDYYLIPDGWGHWKKTDPRIDRERVSSINQQHDGNILQVVRLMKYWNRRSTMPSMSSYLIENIILDFYSSHYPKALKYVNLEVINVLPYIQRAVCNLVYDPKGIQGDINHLSSIERDKISKKAYLDYIKSLTARIFEEEGEHKFAIAKWGEIFGSNFPQYT